MTPRPPGTPQPTNYGTGVQSYIFQIVILVVVILLAFWFLIKPKLAQVAAQRKQVKTLTESRDNTAKVSQTITKLKGDIESNSDKIKVLDEVLPLESRPTKIHVMLEKYVKDAAMSVANIAVNLSENKDLVAAANHELLDHPYGKARTQHTIGTSLTVTGTMDQFKTLLESIETSSRLIDIEAIDIKGDENGLIQFRLTLKTYFYEP